MTEKFSLNYFISTKQQITPEIAPKITKALLTPYSFSSKVAQKVSIWYQNLSQNEKKYLYQIPQFKSALSEKSQITSQHTIHPLWLKEIMQHLPYQFSEQWIRKLANSFCFPTIKLPSGVEISIDSEVFFKTLIWGIKNHPHLIDELNTLIRYNKKPVCVCPENGDATFDLCLGYFDWKKHSLYFQGDIVNYNNIDTISHEIGHVAESHYFEKLIPETSLVGYYDEARQLSKDIFLNTKEFSYQKGNNNPFEDLYKHIKKEIKDLYPSLPYEKIERATAFWTKNEITALFLLDTNQLIHVLNIWHINGIRHTDEIFKEIEWGKKYYTSPCFIYTSLTNQYNALKNLALKQLKRPLFFTNKMNYSQTSFTLFSKKFLAEIVNQAGYINENSNLNDFMLSYCFIKINPDNLNETRVLFKLPNKQFEKRLIQFYATRGILLTNKDHQIETNDPVYINKITRIIHHFFNSPFFVDGKEVFEFKPSNLSFHQRRALLNFLKEKDIPFSIVKNSLLVETKFITDGKLSKQAKKRYLITKEKDNSSDIHHFIKVCNSINLTPKIHDDETKENIFILFNKEDHRIYQNTLKLIKTANTIQQHYDKTFNGVNDIRPSNLLFSFQKKETRQNTR